MNTFDIALPALYKDKWREAYRTDDESSPRFTTYQAPDGSPIPFIYKSIRFTSGQAVDTAEYPFLGLWSNEMLNKKPHQLKISGYLRGEYYLQQRTALLTALFVKTSDETPGFLDMPLWGRFPVVVIDYEVEENADKNGECAVSLTFTRAGVSVTERAAVISPVDFTTPEATADLAVAQFGELQADENTLAQAFGQLKTEMLSVLGRIQGAQAVLNNITNEITGISNLISQGIRSPIELAQALKGAAFSIVAGIVEIKNSVEEVDNYFTRRDNEKNATLLFLSATNFSLGVETVTVKQAQTKAATENLYKTISLCVANEIMLQMTDATSQKMHGYWNLYIKLEGSVDLENPEVYMAIVQMRSKLSQVLQNTSLSMELKKRISKPVPLIYLAHYLSCDAEILRFMNVIEDSFNIDGDTIYV